MVQRTCESNSSLPNGALSYPNSSITLSIVYPSTVLPELGEVAAQRACMDRYACGGGGGFIPGFNRPWFNSLLESLPGWLWFLLLILLILLLLTIPCCIFAWVWYWCRSNRRNRVQSYPVEPKEGTIFYTPPLSYSPTPKMQTSPGVAAAVQVPHHRDAVVQTLPEARPGQDNSDSLPPRHADGMADQSQHKQADQFGEFGNFASIPLSREEPSHRLFGPVRRLSDPYPRKSDYR